MRRCDRRTLEWRGFRGEMGGGGVVWAWVCEGDNKKQGGWARSINPVLCVHVYTRMQYNENDFTKVSFAIMYTLSTPCYCR